MQSMKYILICLALLIGIQASCFANTEQMNATLARISMILKQINPLINEAQKAQNKQARIKFRFDLLRKDIAKIRIGITQQINHITIEPRKVNPLKGDYLKQNQE